MITPEQFITKIVPAGSNYVVGLKRREGIGHRYTTDPAAAAAFALQASAEGHTVYYACASFGPKEGGRKATNAIAAQALWLDIDCGEGKPYPTKRAGLEALGAYLTASHMPRPLVIDSGYGLHVYWPLDRALPRAEWLPLAEALKANTYDLGLQADRTRTADIASVLRPIGTVNRKHGLECEVRLLQLDDGPLAVEHARELLGSLPPAPVAYAAGSNSALSAGLSAGTSAPPKADDVAAGCPQLAAMRDSLGVMDYPSWYACLGVLAYCEDGDETAHEWSAGDSRYRPAQVDKFLADWRKLDGGATCHKFMSVDPGPCAGCAHKDKIRSPLALGRGAVENTTALIAPHPDYRHFDVACGWDRIPPRAWVIGRFAIRGEVTILSAPGGTGKSAYLICLAVASASGRNFLSQAASDRLNVGVLSAEDSRDESLRRARATAIYYSTPLQDLTGCLHLIGAGDLGELSLNRTNPHTRQAEVDKEGIAKLESLVRELSLDVLMLDPLVALCPAGLNDNAVAGATMAELKRMAQRKNCAIIIAHHVRKGTGRDGVVSADDASGAASIINLARNAFSLSRVSENEAQALGVLPSEAWKIIALMNTKSNLAPLANRDLLQLVSVSLPNGDEVQTIEPFTPPQPGANFSPHICLTVLNTLDKGINGVTFSPSKQSRTRKYDVAVGAALKAHYPNEAPTYLQRIARQIVEECTAKGWLGEIQVKGSHRKAQAGIQVVWENTPWKAAPTHGAPTT